MQYYKISRAQDGNGEPRIFVIDSRTASVRYTQNSDLSGLAVVPYNGANTVSPNTASSHGPYDISAAYDGTTVWFYVLDTTNGAMWAGSIGGFGDGLKYVNGSAP